MNGRFTANPSTLTRTDARIRTVADRGDWPLFTANPGGTPGLAMQVSSLPPGPAEMLGPAVAVYAKPTFDAVAAATAALDPDRRR